MFSYLCLCTAFVSWKMKRSSFQAAVVSILLYECTTWTLTKSMEKKLDGNYTRMLRAILNKSCRQHPTKQQLYGHLPHITKAIQVRRTRHAGHCWRSRDELISDVLQWTPSHGRAKAGRPAWTYIQQLCADMAYSLEDLPEAMDNREVWRERVKISMLIARHDEMMMMPFLHPYIHILLFFSIVYISNMYACACMYTIYIFPSVEVPVV